MDHSWNVEYDHELDIVYVEYPGPTYVEDFLAASRKFCRLANENDCSYAVGDLSTYSAAEPVSKMDMVAIMEIYDSLQLSKTTRIALILPPVGTKEEKDAREFEALCYLRGWEFDSFHEKEAAVNWLKKG